MPSCGRRTCRQKRALANFVREDARRRFAGQLKEAAQVVGAGTLLDPMAFTIGFGRRFATYKRANLIFRDIDRLRRLLVDPWRPVQIIFAGKAHPADNPGKEVLQIGVPLHPGSRVRGPGGVPRGLRHAPGAPAGAGRGPLAQSAAGPARGLGHQRHEGRAQWRPPAQHPRRMVAGGLRWTERVGHRSRPRGLRTPTRRTQRISTACWRSRSFRSTTPETRRELPWAGWRRCATRFDWPGAGSPPGA